MTLPHLHRGLLFLSLALGCASTRPQPASPPPPAPAVVAEVLSEPAGLEVAFRGKSVGVTPVQVEIASLAEAVQLTAVQETPPTMERRVRILDAGRVQVLLRVGGEPSPLAQALGLSRVIVFDYGEGTTFDVDHYDLRPSFLPMLTLQAEMLQGAFAAVDVYVCGHTDASGEADHNRVLSVRRAQAVSDFLASLGVAPTRLRTQGFGDQFPVATNATPAGRALNRRTEIVLPD